MLRVVLHQGGHCQAQPLGNQALYSNGVVIGREVRPWTVVSIVIFSVCDEAGSDCKCPIVISSER